MTRKQITACTILQAELGSRCAGLNLTEGGDRDEVGVCVEPFELAHPLLDAPFEQFVYRSAAEREGRHDAPSRDGDLDLTVYSLRKYLRLACGGNPTVLQLLFLPKTSYSMDATGLGLLDLKSSIVSKRAGGAFLGYFQAQRQRLLGERGNGGHGKPRERFVQDHGYDTKFAMHMCRLGYQGIELLETGRITLPMPEGPRTQLLNMRKGIFTLQEVLTLAGELEQQLKDAIDTSPLPPTPHVKRVERWMQETYRFAWKER